MSGRIVELAAIGALVAGVVLSGNAAAETHKEYRFNVGPKAGVSVNNPYGSVSVKPSTGNVVVINAVLSSDKVEVDNALVANRVEIQSHLLSGADEKSGRVDYEILVPADASITLQSNSGSLHVEKLHGDVTLEGAGATVDVRDISNAHVHVRTLNGPVTLTNIQDGHVEIDSLSGKITLTSVNGPQVQVVSTSGEIIYIGDFGDRGVYRFTSYSGNIEASVPETISADVDARSIRGEVHDDIPLQPKEHSSIVVRGSNAFLGTIGRAAVSSRVAMHSFSGKIHLRKRIAK
jgi:DUF4097 and DUF4098 domain-containing protein YvlB